MGYKAIVWSDSPIGAVVTERLPSQASGGAGNSFYTKDLVLALSEKPEFASLESFVAFKRDDECDSFDWRDITSLVAMTKRNASDVKSELQAQGLKLQTYRPSGVGESLNQYRERISGETIMAQKIETFALVAQAVSGKLPEDCREMLLATVKLVNEQGYNTLIENMSREEKATALVELCCSQIRAGEVAAATDAIMSAAKVLNAADEQSEAKKFAAKAADAARVAKRLADKARIYALAEAASK